MIARACGVLAVALLLPACGTGRGGTLTPTVAPQVPTTLTTRSGNGQVTLSWSSQAAGAAYEVKRSVTHGGPYFPISVPSGFTAPTTYVDSGLRNDTAYYYVVAATNAFGRSADSAEAKATPGFKALSIGAGSSALDTFVVLQDRTLWGFGWNASENLGTGRVFPKSAVPLQAAGMTDVSAAASGPECTLALRRDGSIWVWREGITEIYCHPSTEDAPMSGRRGRLEYEALIDPVILQAVKASGLTPTCYAHLSRP